MADNARTIHTIGHSTLEADRFAELLMMHGVATLVDVRSHPGSRHHPQFNSEGMRIWLARKGIGYRWLPDLGGRRRSGNYSRHTAIDKASFRAYADWMETPAFAAGVRDLLAVAESGPIAYCCCESVYWKCHRRMITDYLTLRLRIDVKHITQTGSLIDHRPTRGVRLDAAGLTYDVGGTAMLPLSI